MNRCVSLLYNTVCVIHFTFPLFVFLSSSCCLFILLQTSGLDAFTARHVVETLLALARRGKTVVMSIHQPRYDVFGLVDDVILLSQGGRQVWSGCTKDLMKHLESLGHPCPVLVNPADFLLDMTSIDFRSETRTIVSSMRLELLTTSFDKRLAVFSLAEEGCVVVQAQEERPCSEIVTTRDLERPLTVTLPILLKRSVTNLSRQPVLCSARLSQGIFFALILCAFYAPVGDNQNSIQNIIGNLYELTSLCFIGMLSCIAQFPTERNVFYREYTDGYYSVLSFYLTYFSIAIPFVLVCAAVISVLMTHAIGLLPTSDGFILFTGMVFIILFFGECIGVMFCSIFLHIGFSVNIMSMCISGAVLHLILL